MVTIEFDSVELTLSSPSPADDDGNLALGAPDLTIDSLEMTAVTFTVTGLDADATALVTVSDGAASVSGSLSANGDLVLDLSDLAFGSLTTSVTATDAGGATATVAGPALTLAPASGDDDGNLALAAPDLAIDGAEMTAVTFTVTGLDADATALVTVSDGAASVSGSLSADGDLVLDLSDLADGPLTTSVTATDAGGATATVAGPGLTLDSAPPPPPPPLSFAGETRALSIDLGVSELCVRGAGAADRRFDHARLSGLHRPGDAGQPCGAGGLSRRSVRGSSRRGAFIDFVGRYAQGPDELARPEHSGKPGVELRQLVDAGILADDVGAYSPDVVLLMAGTNDINASGSRFFDILFPRVIDRVEQAVTQFYANVEAGKHLVDLDPAGRSEPGTSRREGDDQRGLQPRRWGGGGWAMPATARIVRGSRRRWPGLQADHPTLHLYDAPFDASHVGADGVHLTDEGYAAYAAGLQTLLETEIGISGGTLGGTAQSLGQGDRCRGRRCERPDPGIGGGQHDPRRRRQ